MNSKMNLSKLLSIVLFTITFISTTNSQNIKNRFLIGGELGGIYSKNKVNNFESYLGDTPIDIGQDLDYNVNSFTYTDFSLNFTPSLLYYLNDNLLIGGGIEWFKSNKKIDDDVFQNINDNSFTIYPALRQYLYKGIFLQGQIDFGKTLYKVDCKNIYPSYTGTSSDKSSEAKGLVFGYGISGDILFN